MPLSLAFALALTATPSPADLARCTADRLRRFASPMGISQPWPRDDALATERGVYEGSTLLSDSDAVADGYRQTLHVDAAARRAWVIEQGGYAGTVRVYGPLPVASCPR